jgi:adenylate cyclase
MFFSFTATKSSIYTVADNLLSEISKSVLTKTQAYLLPAERAARSVAWLLWNNRLNVDAGPEMLLDYFQELIQSNPEFKTVYSADTAGNLVMARRMPDGSLSRRYVPADLVSQLVGQKHEASLGGECRQLTILFSDIANFTTISEHLAPEVLVQDLCEYFNVISRTILAEKGTLDKYIGDSVMAFWGAPLEVADHAYRACLAAVTAQDRLAHLFRQWESKGQTRFATRIGIHTDEVVVGNMGYEERLNYTVIGDGVNLSSRLEGLNKFYGTSTLVSHTTAALVRDHFEFRRVDRVAVKGKTEGADVFELLAIKGDIPVNLRKLMDIYEQGLAVYEGRDWKFALQHFNTMLKYRPGDGPSQVLAARCRRFMAQSPPETWNLTWEWNAK